MSAATTSLCPIFAARWRGVVGEPEAVEVALRELHERGRRAHPTVAVPAVEIAAYAGERAPEDLGAPEAIRALRAEDLHLACACARADPAALRVFERDFLSRLPVYLQRLRASADVEDETRRALLEKLFLAAPGHPPRILQYSGRGALEGWVRVAALRTALHILRDQGASEAAVDAAAAARLVDRGDDPELGFLKAAYRAPFAAALREALAAAPHRTRVLLHLAFVDGLPAERIGQLYAVHRTTVTRWIDAARAEILRDTRARLAASLRLSAAECDQILALVQSHLDVTLRSLLGSSAERAAAELSGR